MDLTKPILRSNSSPSKRQTEKAKQEISNNSSLPIVGTCCKHEKQYYRLGSNPDPATIRPEKVLREWIPILLSKWSCNRDYEFICDQFKSVRQDLLIQRIQNEFAVEVYELNARIALEMLDTSEFAVCMSQLETLAENHIFGHTEEFLAYTILQNAVTMNSLASVSLLKRVCVKHKEDLGYRLLSSDLHLAVLHTL